MAASTPVWLSRDRWLDEVRCWAESPELAQSCAAARAPIAAATLLSIAAAWAGFADHGTGRHAAVTRESIAQVVGCHVRTVTRAWTVLAAGGWAVEAARGHGSARTPRVGNRPSVWHLVSRCTDRTDLPVGDDVHLPPSRRDRRLTHVGKESPSAPTGAAQKAISEKPARRRRRHAAPQRPLAVQRLAGQLVAHAHGLDRGHIGAVCDALLTVGVDPSRWTAKTLVAALDADMRARGWSWPDRIDRPGAFLASRLRRLQLDDRGQVPKTDGGVAAGIDQGSRMTGHRVSDITGDAGVCSELTAAQRARITAAQDAVRAQLARRRAVSGEAGSDSVAGVRSRRVAADVPARLVSSACAACGAPDAPRRAYLPAHRGCVCDACWEAGAQSGGKTSDAAASLLSSV